MPAPLRLVFLATGPLAVPAIQPIAAAGRDQLLAVVTQPPRPAGRRRQLTQCPAAQTAAQLGIPLLQPENVNSETDPAALPALRELRPDLLLVADYGQFLRTPLLALPTIAAINLHPSLLPRFRGATPLQRTLLCGDQTTGVSILYVTARMDAGDVLDQVTVPVQPEETCPQLGLRLAMLGARQLLAVLDRFRAARAPLPGTPQDESRVILAPLLSRADGQVDWNRPALAIYDQWRAFTPWPGIFTHLPDGTPLKLLQLSPPFRPPVAVPPGFTLDDAEASACAPGTVLAVCGPTLLVATATTPLQVLLLQPAGKPPMPPVALVNGRRLASGDRLT